MKTFKATEKARKVQEDAARAAAQAKLDAFIAAEAKLEEEHGCEIVAELMYGQLGISPRLIARVKAPNAPTLPAGNGTSPAEAGQAQGPAPESVQAQDAPAQS